MVVVTHMGPSSRSIPERYRDQLLSAAFASDLDILVSKVDLWVHGHIHDSMDYRLGKARLVCNPLGHPLRGPDGRWFRENPKYDPDLIFEIGLPEPAQQILLDAAAQREELAAERLTASDVSAGLWAPPRNGTLAASQLCRDGRLLGCTSVTRLPAIAIRRGSSPLMASP